MAANLLQVVDRETRSRILFDLNDLDAENSTDYGGVATELLGNPDWGSARYSFDRFEPPSRDGGRTVFGAARPTEATLRVRIVATEYDTLYEAVGALSSLLASGCTLKWVPAGSAYPRYVDIEPTQTPALLDGRDRGLYEVTRQFATNAGVELKLYRQPYFEGGLLDPTTNRIGANSTLLLDTLDNTDTVPDYWQWTDDSDISDAGVVSDQEAFGFTIATDGAVELLQSGESATITTDSTYAFSIYAKIAGGTTAYAKAAIQFKDNVAADVGALNEGTLTQLTTGWQRLTVTGLASDGDEDYAEWGIVFDNTDAAPVTVYIRFAQFEEADAPTRFVVAPELVDQDPAGYSGRGLPVWIWGDAPTPVNTLVTADDDAQQFLWAGTAGRDYQGQGSLTAWINGGRYIQCEDGTNGTDTADRTDAAASPQTGTSARRTTFSTEAMSPRVTISTSDEDQLACLQGREWLMKVRVKPSADDVFTIRVDATWGGSFDAPASSYVATVTGDGSGNWTEVPVGVVGFPDILSGGLQIICNAAGTSATTLDWDLLEFLPLSSAMVDLGQEISAAGYSFYTDPDEPTLAALDDTGLVALTAGISIHGPVPFVARCGLNAAYVAVLSEPGTGTHGASDITSVITAQFPYRPRFHG